jgi:2-methylisocitrate lyase-like PEP mutase family enzyme
MIGQSAKAVAFKTLHEQPGAFVVPNPWDIGSTRMLATFGFKALATTSAGFSFSLGRADDTSVVGQ